jgi:ribonuclease HI
LQAARSLSWLGTKAAFLALQLSRDMGFEKISLEGDAKMIIEAVESEETDWSRRGHLIEYIRLALKSFACWKLTHVNRGVNQAAHELARLPAKQNMDMVWRHDSPECISSRSRL